MDSTLRKMLLFVVVTYGAYLAYITTIELIRAAQRAEVATLRAELSAWQVRELMDEAREITRRAAEESQ